MTQILSPPVVENGFPNPRAASNLTGWAAVGSSAISLLATDGYYAGTCVDVTSTSGTQTAVAAGSPATTYGCPVTAGQLVFVRCAVKHVSAPGAAQYALAVAYYNAAGTTIATVNLRSPPPSLVPGGVWTVVDGFDVAPAGAAFAQATVTLTSTSGAAEFRVTDMQITPDQGSGGIPPPVFGDQPGCVWAGTAHASMSIGPAGYLNLVPNPQTAQTVSGTFGAGSTAQVLAPVTVFGGQEITATATPTFTTIPVGAKLYLRLSWLDSQGTVLPESSLWDVRMTAGTQATVTKAAPATAHQARIDVLMDTAGSYTLSFASLALIPDSGAAPTRPWRKGFNDNNTADGPKTQGQDVALYQELGADTIRFGGLSLDEPQPTATSPLAWDGTRWAKLLSQCRQAGLRAIPIAGFGAAWMSGVVTTLSASLTIPGGQAGTAVANVPLTSTAGWSTTGGNYAWIVCDSGQVVPVGFTAVSGGQLTGCTLGFSATADTASAGAQAAQGMSVTQTVSNAATIGTAVGQLAAEFADVIAAVEVWNEPNLTVVWAGPDPAAYTTLLKGFYTAFKAVAPSVPVIAGALNQYSPNNARSGQDATGMDPGTFLAAMYANGAKGSMDGVSCHPYSNLSGTGAPAASVTDGFQAGFWPTVDKVRVQIAAAGDTIPIWVTEIGVRTPGNQPVGAQAALYRYWQGTLRRQPDLRACMIHTLFQNQIADTYPNDYGVLRWPGNDRRPAFFRLQADWTRSFVGYFDGGTSGASWSGTANASVSILPRYVTVPLTGREGWPQAQPSRLQPGVAGGLQRQSVTFASTATAPAALKQASTSKGASTATVGAVLKQARPVKLASSAVTAAVTAGKVISGLLLTATVTTVASMSKQVRIVRSAASTVAAGMSRLVRMIRQAATALVGSFIPGATPAVCAVTFAQATYVNVTVGPL